MKSIRIAAWVAVVVTYFLIALGGTVLATDSGLSCPDWPLCYGQAYSSGTFHVFLEEFHRFTAATVSVLIVLMVVGIIAWARKDRALLAMAIAAPVLLKEPAFVAGLHLAVATTVWGALVLLAALASNQLRAAPQQQELEKMERAEAESAEANKGIGVVRQTIANYVDLMKPHVTVLLLGVTAAAMAIARQSLPPLALVIPTLLGGAMAAGSANCINCYIDRDIDQIMGRTQRRSLPSGRVEPRQALAFGIFLGISSFVVLALFVNLLSAVLAFSAILFYVFVYTIWLKRSTVQNIVIGGAAGAVPVLVGWAAVTNNLSLPAIWLFAIIFFWTPPHFWALSLLIQKDYEKAGIPMLPVVKGEAETRRQILLYSLLLLAITLVLFAMGIMGYFYLAGALILGGGLVYLAIRLWRDQSKKWARTLFWYSNMYLAAIFAIMVLDRVIH